MTNVIEFVRFGDAIKRKTIICVHCQSRGVRIITDDDGTDKWMVECYNCGEEIEGLEAKWQD